MKTLVTVFFALLALNMYAQTISYGGNGCPPDSIQTTQNADGTLLLETDAYDVLVNDTNLARESCNIALSWDVPEGYAVAFSNATVSGDVDLRTGVSLVFEAETFLAGRNGQQFSSSITGPASFPMHKEMTPSLVWSECGSSPMFRLNTSLVLRSNLTDLQPSTARIEKIIIPQPYVKKCPAPTAH